jgi:hypothetical protein
VTDVKERRDPATLPEDIYRVLDSASNHEVSEENVEWAGEVFKSLLRSRLQKREEKKGEDVLRFSALGKKDRQIWYDANMPEVSEKLPGKMSFKFLYGDVLEVLMLFLAKEAGHEVTHEQHEVDVDGVKGHMDAVIDGVPVDCKSASTYSFQKFKDGSFVFNDPFGYVKQLSGYAHAIGKTDRAGFLVCDKTHGDICFAELDEYSIEANPPGPRISELRGIIPASQPPARCYADEPEGKSGNRKLGLNCSYCSYKDECWKDANHGKGLRKFFYSRGPVWLTEVKKEPKVDEDAS